MHEAKGFVERIERKELLMDSKLYCMTSMI